MPRGEDLCDCELQGTLHPASLIVPRISAVSFFLPKLTQLLGASQAFHFQEV